MKKEKRVKSIAKSIGTGIFAVFLFLLFYFAVNKNTAPYMLILKEVFPLYDNGMTSVFNSYAYANINEEDVFIVNDGSGANGEGNEITPGDLEKNEQAAQSDIAEESKPVTDIIGISNVTFQPETDIAINNNSQTDLLTNKDLEKLMDFDYLKSKLYTVDGRTELTESDIDVQDFLSKDFRLNMSEKGPKILIFHTHSQESFKDSIKGDLNDGIFAVGEELKKQLEAKHGIEVLHDKSSYDIVNGESSILGAYERLESSIPKILAENPSIELVIDMHRDSVGNDLKFVTEINGKPTAKVMFFNGLCKIKKNGKAAPTQGLSNPYVQDNLALSLQMQLNANELYSDFTRKVYLNAYRYSLHFKPKSLLIEVGADTNTKQEALNAMEPLADVLAKTIKQTDIEN